MSSPRPLTISREIKELIADIQMLSQHSEAIECTSHDQFIHIKKELMSTKLSTSLELYYMYKYGIRLVLSILQLHEDFVFVSVLYPLSFATVI